MALLNGLLSVTAYVMEEHNNGFESNSAHSGVILVVWWSEWRSIKVLAFDVSRNYTVNKSTVLYTFI